MGEKKQKRAVHARSATKPVGTFRLLDGIQELDRILARDQSPTLADLAAELEVSPRTVQRYLAYMRDSACAEVVFDKATGGFRYQSPARCLPAAHLGEEELLALFVAEPILAQYADTPLEAQFRRAFERLCAPLPPRVRKRLEPARRRLGVKAAMASNPDVERFRVVLRATLENRVLELTYFSAHRGATSVRQVEPYALRSVDGRWYLLAFCRQRRRVLPFVVARIWVAVDLGEPFRHPEGFDADVFLEGALGVFLPPEGSAAPQEVVLRFDRFAARYLLEQRWHPSQRERPLEGGAVEVGFTLESTVELERLILSWGEHVEVLAPAELRSKIRDRAMALSELYRGPPAPQDP